MANFSFLEGLKEFQQLKQYCDNAELFVLSKPEISAVSSRQALEFLVKAVYISKDVYLPENASLFELVDNFVFSGFVDNNEILTALHYIRKVGNRGAHGEVIKKKEALFCLQNLHYFVGEILIKLGEIKTYSAFDEKLLTTTKEKAKIADTEVVIDDTVKQKLENKLDEHATMHLKNPQLISEAETRKLFIDESLKSAGWEVLETKNFQLPSKAGIEIEVQGMPNEHNIGYVDYVLFGRNNKPLALVEAKKTSVSPIKGEHQAVLYADCLEKEYGYRPVVYFTNGYETKIIDGLGYPARKVFGFHTIDELELLIQRKNRKSITDLSINDKITNRGYQKMAITKVCEHFNTMKRRALIVMATGTGKTRVAISLVDVLIRNNWVKNVLFLADRTALITQSKKNFAKFLPDETICELSDKSTKRDFNARIMFSTYQTMINFIDKDEKDFSIGRFDMIIIDEAHRSVFNKYKAIFTYFDSLLVGLTATPRSEVDRSTYELFNLEEGVPNFHYELDEAVKDGYLVNYIEFDRTSAILKRGVKYNQLNEEDKQKVEITYGLDENTPVDILPNHIFRIIYNKDTVDKVLQGLMNDGLKVSNGEKIGKTIIFAYNHNHAEFIVDRFRTLFPECGNEYCKLIDNYVTYTADLIAKFEDRDKEPQIAVSVDMLDTGIDIPDVLNLVFFKPVKSKIKFLQMIGRGTRLSPDIFGRGKDKEKFYIFDYCDNFEYFEQNSNAESLTNVQTITEKLFNMKADVLFELQALGYQEDAFAKSLYQKLKTELMNDVAGLNLSRILVRDRIAYVEKYKFAETWDYLSKLEVQELKTYISSLIMPNKDDEKAKLFDLKMFMIELSLLNKDINANKQIEDVVKIANLLYIMTTIPKVKKHIEVIQEVRTNIFWQNMSLPKLEEVRIALRDLVKFLEGLNIPKSFIDVPDDITYGKERQGVDIAKIRTYEEKVLDYLSKHSNNPVVNKIRNLEQIDRNDLQELENVLWKELGTKDDYEKCTNKNNLAVFVRSLIGLSGKAINEKFGKFLNENTLTSKQQEFVKAIINYVRENGDIELENLVETSPFDEFDWVKNFGEKFVIVKQMIDYMKKVVSVGE